MMSELERTRKEEHRTRSELIREALRRYLFTSGNKPHFGESLSRAAEQAKQDYETISRSNVHKDDMLESKEC